MSIKIERMQRAVRDYVRANMPEAPNKSKMGIVRGQHVLIDQKLYRFIPTVDLYFSDGDAVCCILPDEGNVAAVVGVF